MLVPSAATARSGTPAHPLEPLAADEIEAVRSILLEERESGPSLRFVSVSVHEPPKHAVLALGEGERLDREAFVVLYDREASATYEAVVSLTHTTVRSWRHVPGVQPSFMFEEIEKCEEVVRADPRWRAAMRERGVEDFDLCMIDTWPAGYTGEGDLPENGRICRPLTWVRAAPNENGYAHPVEGLIVTVDLDRMEVLAVDDHGVVPLPTKGGNYIPEMMDGEGNRPASAALRDDVKPIEITQPEGTSFQVDGHAVSWQKWRLRLGYTPREGLVLHQVGYEDRGRLRPVLYRASLSEMFVPYGDPSPTHFNKNVFDMGEVGLGGLANPLELGCDCLGEVTYFDAVVNDADGHPLTIKNAVCLHEEDAGMGWKHTDFRTEHVEVRRMRRLVISFVCTVGNYEYGFYWSLYQDGSIEYQVKLTGVLSTGAVAPGTVPAHGTLVAPGLYGPNHQHFFCVRIDPTIDGPGNSVYEVNSVPLPPGEGNPWSNAWVAEPTLLASESQAQRVVDQRTGRFWKVENPSVRNELGQPVAYKLTPGENVFTMLQEGAHALNRARFAEKHLWVTRYDHTERYAAGDYPYQSAGGDGLPVYAADDEPLEDEDVVLWYSFGAHHVPRPEDWPVMPVASLGFHLKPMGFFDGNPALDVPRSPAAGCHAGGEDAVAEGQPHATQTNGEGSR